MFADSCTDKAAYTMMVDAVKQLSREKRELIKGKKYSLGDSLLEKKKLLQDRGPAGVKYIVEKNLRYRKNIQYYTPVRQPAVSIAPPNYFSDARIAVYTCIIGRYDGLLEPAFVPNNCDYYAVTDFEIPEGSRWKRIPADRFGDLLEGMSPVMRNRYFKMHPHVLFPDYRYSIYLDGNLRICTDMTEFLNRLSPYGISCFRHSLRNDVYQEAEACSRTGKGDPAEIAEHVAHLRAEGMPEGYGLALCSVLVRDHEAPGYEAMMDLWWNEFCSHSKRDQISFPYVMYKSGIPMEAVTVLGTNIFDNDAFEVEWHEKRFR